MKDIIEFIENVLDIKLKDYQKKYLQFLDKYKDSNYIPMRPRGDSKSILPLLIYKIQNKDKKDK